MAAATPVLGSRQPQPPAGPKPSSGSQRKMKRPAALLAVMYAEQSVQTVRSRGSSLRMPRHMPHTERVTCKWDRLGDVRQPGDDPLKEMMQPCLIYPHPAAEPTAPLSHRRSHCSAARKPAFLRSAAASSKLPAGARRLAASRPSPGCEPSLPANLLPTTHTAPPR